MKKLILFIFIFLSLGMQAQRLLLINGQKFQQVADSAQFNFSWTTSNVSGFVSLIGDPDAVALTGSQNGYNISTMDPSRWIGNGTAAAGYVSENTANPPHFLAENGSGYFFHQSTTIPSGGNIEITVPDENYLYRVYVLSDRPQTTDNRLTQISLIDSNGTTLVNNVNSAPSTNNITSTRSQITSGGTWILFDDVKPNYLRKFWLGIAAAPGNSFGYVNSVKIVRIVL